jgi:hypothetical protein
MIVSATAVTLPAVTTSYIYLNTSTGAIQSNTSGFPNTNCYSIATVLTSHSGIIILTDNRPDVTSGGGGGGGGTAEYVQTISATPGSVIGFGGAFNTLVKVTGGAVTIPLPTAVGISGQIIRTIMTVSGTTSFTTQSGQTINGSATLPQLTNQWQTISMESDNANWIIVSTAN